MRALALVTVLTTIAACGHHEMESGAMSDRIAAARMENDRHHRGVAAASSLDDVRLEVDRHAGTMDEVMSDMHGEMQGMMGDCSSMMEEMDGMMAMMGGMDDEMAAHHDAMMGAGSVADAITASEDHHARMEQLLGDMQQTMDAMMDGMGGGGCCGM